MHANSHIQVADAFSRAASQYNALATQQQQVRQYLLQRLEAYQSVSSELVLDVGCATGQLKQERPDWKIIGLDFAANMCRTTKELGGRAIQADMHALPIKPASCQLWFSSLALQWSDHVEDAFEQAYRCLKPGGVLACSVYVSDSLNALKQAFAAIDAYAHVREFMSVDKINNHLVNNGFIDIQSYRKGYIRQDKNFMALLRYFKELGAYQLPANRRKSLLTPNQLNLVEQRYREITQTPDGDISSNWQVGFFLARKPR